MADSSSNWQSNRSGKAVFLAECKSCWDPVSVVQTRLVALYVTTSHTPWMFVKVHCRSESMPSRSTNRPFGGQWKGWSMIDSIYVLTWEHGGPHFAHCHPFFSHRNKCSAMKKDLPACWASSIWRMNICCGLQTQSKNMSSECNKMSGYVTSRSDIHPLPDQCTNGQGWKLLAPLQAGLWQASNVEDLSSFAGANGGSDYKTHCSYSRMERNEQTLIFQI